MNIAFWGVYESSYPRNKTFVEALQNEKEIDVRLFHIPLFEKEKDKSGSYLGPVNLLVKGVELLIAYIRLSLLYIKNRREIDVWICGYIGQSDVLFLYILKKLFTDKTPILFNSLLSLYDTLVLDRGKFKENSIMGRIFFHVDRLAFKYADGIVIDTIQHKNYISSTFHISEEKISVVPVIADSVFFDYPLVFPALEKTPFTLQLVGKFIPLYGLEYVLEAAEILKDEDIRFEFIGGGQLEEWFKNEIKRLNLKNVELRGWISFEKLPEAMSTAHVSLGIFDPGSKSQRVVPNKVFQSLAMGKITLTADSPAIRELTDCESILFLVPPASGKAIAEKIIEIRNTYPALKTMSDKAADYSRKFYHPSSLGNEIKRIISKLS